MIDKQRYDWPTSDYEYDYYWSNNNTTADPAYIAVSFTLFHFTHATTHMDHFDNADEKEARLHWVDYLILGLALILSSSFGVFYAFRWVITF